MGVTGGSVAVCLLLMTCCGQRAMDLLNTIRARGLEPNEITYNVVMGACGAAGRWKEALDLFYEMQGAGLPPDAVTFGEAADDTCCCSGDGRTCRC